MTLRWNKTDSFSRNVKFLPGLKSGPVYLEKKVYNLQQTNRQKK